MALVVLGFIRSCIFLSSIFISVLYADKEKDIIKSIPFHQQSAESCKECHLKQYQEWSKSTHKISFTNPTYQKGYKVEGNKRCLNCHLPLESQRISVESSTPHLLNEGVTCVSCHTAHSSQAHKNQSSKLCSQCHQFNFRHTPVAAQNTYQEWLYYKQKGGTKRCQDCHMNSKSHDFKFNRPDVPYSEALSFKVKKSGNNFYLTLKNKGAGHNIPTGDIFRHLQIQAGSNGHLKTLYWIGRNPFFRYKDQSVVWKHNNSLRPGESRVFKISLKDVKQIRVVYFKEAYWAGVEYFSSPLQNVVLYDHIF